MDWTPPLPTGLSGEKFAVKTFFTASELDLEKSYSQK